MAALELHADRGPIPRNSKSLPANVGVISEYSVAEENNDIEIGLDVDT